jgi:hypothetical protein
VLWHIARIRDSELGVCRIWMGSHLSGSFLNHLMETL